MPQYFAPGVYVEETPSGVQPIVGVGTSTAGFVGVLPNDFFVARSKIEPVVATDLVLDDGSTQTFDLPDYPVEIAAGTFEVRVSDIDAELENDEGEESAKVILSYEPEEGAKVTADYAVKRQDVVLATTIEGTDFAFRLPDYPVETTEGTYVIRVLDSEGKPVTTTDGNGETEITWTPTLTDQETFAEVTLVPEPPVQVDDIAVASVVADYAVKLTGIDIGIIESGTQLPLPHYPVEETKGTFEIRVVDPKATLKNLPDDRKSVVDFSLGHVPGHGATISADYYGHFTRVKGRVIGHGDGETLSFPLPDYPVDKSADLDIQVFDRQGQLENLDAELAEGGRVARVAFENPPSLGSVIKVSYRITWNRQPVDSGTVKLCTSFADYCKFFGGFSTDREQNRLAHAVNGFFLNGGTRCYVMRVEKEGEITTDLFAQKFAPIDEIAIVAAPGITDDGVAEAIVNHCQQVEDRFAILDGPQNIDPTNLEAKTFKSWNYAALYYPWFDVNDPATKLMYPDDKTRWPVEAPPSGHMAGIYARVDAQRGVHKAPANETVRGIIRVKYPISRNQQEGLNRAGINCIRELNGDIRVWGARTLGGDANQEWKYINVRRLFLFLRESIDEGMQWVVFEPNTPDLWAKITRNVTAFLTTVWRSGALFGSTPAEAFYVKCDAELNPLEERENGRVWTEIGVSVAKPAEFVIFRISQWAGPSG